MPRCSPHRERENSLCLEVKDPTTIKEDLITYYTTYFSYLSKIDNYVEFVTLLRTALKEDWNIIENEEFPGRMFKFYKHKNLIKAIYIKGEQIKILDSFAEEYKKLQMEKIKEILNTINEQLKIEGKDSLKLEFKEND